MGFIDYHGTKENRYYEVLEFSRDQRHEEVRRLQFDKINRWLLEIFNDNRYAELSLNELMKCIVLRYRKLESINKQLMFQMTDELQIDAHQLWADFCLDLLIKRMKISGLETEKWNTYYDTFAMKVFKLQHFTPFDKHMDMLKESQTYKSYISSCFDLVLEKQYWRLMGYHGKTEYKLLTDFICSYEQLSVLLGFYLFQCVQPENITWIQRLDIEREILEKLKTDYSKNRFREPNYPKLRNPLYVNDVTVQKEKDCLKENLDEDFGHNNIQSKRPALDKQQFESLLKEQNIKCYVEACELLRKCELPEQMDVLYNELIGRLPVLQETMDKYIDVYQPDMYQFYEYYIPEALQLTSAYIEYLDAGMSEKIFRELENDVLEAVRKLIVAINDKVDDIYKFALIDIKAQAKALENIMSQDGYVDSKFKI